MVVIVIPYWLDIIICYAFLSLSIIFLISVKVVGENTQVANRGLNAETGIFRELMIYTEACFCIFYTRRKRYMTLLDTVI